MTAIASEISAVAPGVWVLPLRTPTLPPATTTNTCLFVGERVLIVEPATPFPEERDKLDGLIREFEQAGKVVAGIALTHHHVDHIGYAEQLREKLAVPIYAHRETCHRISWIRDPPIDDGWSIDLGNGHQVQARFTPGHAPGHLIYTSEFSNHIYVGDLVAGEGTIQIDPHDSGDMKQYLRSLEATLNFCRDAPGPQHLIASHGPVIEDAEGILSYYIQHRLSREQKILEVLGQQSLSLDELLSGAYADKPAHVWPIAKPALVAHINKLIQDGIVHRQGDIVTGTGSSDKV